MDCQNCTTVLKLKTKPLKIIQSFLFHENSSFSYCKYEIVLDKACINLDWEKKSQNEEIKNE